MKRKTKGSSPYHALLLVLLLSTSQPLCVSAQTITQQRRPLIRSTSLGPGPSSTSDLGQPRRALDTNDTTDGLLVIEPVICPGPDCVQVEDVDYYLDSTGGTQYAALCYKPPYCVDYETSATTGGIRCPLYVWIDGTSHNDILEIPDKYFLREMVSRGFVSCVAKYDDSPSSYLEGCPSFHSKARDIFDPLQSGSLLSQLCQAGTHADCNVGLAVHGWGQGAHLAVLAADYVNVTASLQFGNGNLNGVLSVETNVSCVSSDNISPLLPPTRRRSIVGEEDQFFNRPTIIDQQKDITGYDCGDLSNCFGRLPEGCTGLEGAIDNAMIEQCATSGQFFHTSCPDLCPYTSTAYCAGVETPYACPIYVPDALTGGYIEDTGGYYIVPGQDHGFFIRTPASANASDVPVDGATESPMYEFEFEEDFLDPYNIWGLKQSLDWLDRTARHVQAIPLSLIPTNLIKPTIESSFPDIPTMAPGSPSDSGVTDLPSYMPSSAPSRLPFAPAAPSISAPSSLQRGNFRGNP